MDNITVKDGIYTIGGENFTEAELSERFGVASGILIKTAKSVDAMIKKTATTEYSRAKRVHKENEYKRIIEGDNELLAQVEKFGKTVEDFMERATELVNTGKGQRT